MNGADMRMIQFGSGMSFALKALQRCPVGSEGMGQNLDRDDAFQASVSGLVHSPMPPFSTNSSTR